MSNGAQTLLALAREPSAARRRELLLLVTQAFAEAADGATAADKSEFARLAAALLDQFEANVRAEFAERFADLPSVPLELISKLAHDVIAVARPVLERSAALPDPELVALSLVRGPEHLNAIASRARVSEMVADVLVRRGDDRTLVTLVRNSGADLSREAFERLAERSENVIALRRPMAERADTPIDLLNDMLIFVEDEVRRAIMTRVSATPREALDAALRAARQRAAARRLSSPGEDAIAAEINDLNARGRLTKPLIVDWMRAGDLDRFVAGLAAWLDVDGGVARKMWRSGSIEALATAVRASDGDRAFFVTLAMHREGVSAREHGRAALLGEAYEAIPVEAARRAMAFWRVRRSSLAA